MMASTTTHLGPVRYIDGCAKLSSHIPVHIEQTENFDFSEALLSKYDVLDKILSYLSYKDLSSAAQINEIWAASVEAVLKKRIFPTLFSFASTCYNQLPDPVAIKPSLCIVFLECVHDRDREDLSLKLSSYICIHKPHTEVKETVIEFLENDLLSAKCPLVALSCRQISSSFTNISTLNGLVFPSIPNIKVSVFRVTEPLKILPTLLEQKVGKDNDVVCLLTYAVCLKRNKLRELIKEIRKRQPSVNFAFGGGFVRGMQTFNVRYRKPVYLRDDLLCITFSKPSNMDVPFNSYSIVIPEEATSFNDIEHYFIELQSNYTPRKYSIAFRITCVSREDEVQKEMTLFKKYFPETEIIGFNGDGEIGWNYYKEDREDEPKRRKISTKTKAVHELTTIIVLLTWGRERK